MLYIISTPIGNLKDITKRAIETIESLDYLLCEDSRVSGGLLKKLGIKNKPALISFYDEVEQRKIPEIIELLRSGKEVGLVSDAGTPLISDPGWLLVKRCQKEGLLYTALPGANSIINAIVLSGLPPSRFSFLGFLPKRYSLKIKLLEEYSRIEGLKVCFESPHRLERTVNDIRKVYGQVEIRVCREMTKMHETVEDGNGVFSKKGEATIIFY